jgi:hypothetical protein
VNIEHYLGLSHGEFIYTIVGGLGGGAIGMFINERYRKKHGSYMGCKQCPNCGHHFNFFWKKQCGFCKYSLVISESNPSFLQRKANIIGKTVIIGFSYENSKGDIVERKQFYGKIVDITLHKGIAVLLNQSDEMRYLPSQLKTLEVAPPGEYRLISTGEVVVNPDFITTWIVNKSQ